jgi:hypothetical protein
MGGVLSQNTINDAVNFMVQTVNTTSQDCKQILDESNITDIEGSTFQNITINVGSGQNLAVDIQCAQNASATNNINSSLQQDISQLATAINQNLNLNPGSTEASNVLNLLTNLSVITQNTYQQECVTNAVENISTIILNTKGDNLNISDNAQQTLNSIANCTQQTVTDNQITTSLIQQITQSATAKVENALGLLFILLTIIAIVFLVLIYAGGKALLSPPVLAFIFGIILLYVLLAIWRGWWPFKKKNTNTNNNQT